MPCKLIVGFRPLILRPREDLIMIMNTLLGHLTISSTDTLISVCISHFGIVVPEPYGVLMSGRTLPRPLSAYVAILLHKLDDRHVSRILSG